MPDRLFDVPDLPEPEQLSAGQRLTRRNAEQLARGINPATNHPFLKSETPLTCGDCAHHIAVHVARTYHKCERHRLGESHSAASDIRVSWPACSLFTPEETS